MSEYKIDTSGTKIWRLNGNLHRENGPAIICTDGYKEWWINGKLIASKGMKYRFHDGKYIVYKNYEEFIKYEKLKIFW